MTTLTLITRTLIASMLATAAGSVAFAQANDGDKAIYPLTVMHAFGGTKAGDDGSEPEGGVIVTDDGSVYGTTSGGGAKNLGTIFKISPDGVESVLYSFNRNIAQPKGRLSLGSDGMLYGVTYGGGNQTGTGTVYRIGTDGANFKIIHDFDWNLDDDYGDGNPLAGLVLASDGNLYGTEANSPKFHGAIYRQSPSGAHSVIFQFGSAGLQGSNPESPLIQASDGALYGVTNTGGAYGIGTIYRVTLNGRFNVMHSFTPEEGGYSTEPLVEYSSGLFYGVTQSAIFSMTEDGTVTVLHTFPDSQYDGFRPSSGLVVASDGQMYGSTLSGGHYSGNATKGYGTVYRVTESGIETVVHSFPKSSHETIGDQPMGERLAASVNGMLYGVCSSGGGAGGNGTVFNLAIPQ